MEHLLTLFKVASDETRLRILLALNVRPLCVCEMTSLFNESQPKISKHLSKLRDLNLVLTQREDKYMVYTLNQTHPTLLDFLALTKDHMVKDSLLWQDQQQLTIPELWACIGVDRDQESSLEVTE